MFVFFIRLNIVLRKRCKSKWIKLYCKSENKSLFCVIKKKFRLLVLDKLYYIWECFYYFNFDRKEYKCISFI